ncbi:zmpB [Symbiodinium sp. KB8]|nr:zmpB [Symbiodinium sp. KB8]
MAARERREKLRAAQREKAAAQLEKPPRRRVEETTAEAQDSPEPQSSPRVVEETGAEPVEAGAGPVGSPESAAEELPALEAPAQQTEDRPDQEAKTEVERVSSNPSAKEQPKAKTPPAEAQGRKDEVLVETSKPQEESRVESADVKPSMPPKPVVEEAAIADDASPNVQDETEDATQRRAWLRSSRRSTVSVQALPRRGSRASENAREDADASQRRREDLNEAFEASHRALQRLTAELFLGVQVDHLTGRSLRLSPSSAQLEDLRAEHRDAFHRRLLFQASSNRGGRLLKIATACAFDNMALIAQQRSAQQGTRKAQWRTSEDFRQEARAKEILQRRGRLAANHAQDVSSGCAEEAGEFVHQLQVLEQEVSPEKRAELDSCQTALLEECKSLAENVTAFRLLAESLAVPSADGRETAPSPLAGTWSQQKLGLGLRGNLAAGRLERSLATAAGREGPWPPQLPLEEPLAERLQAEKEAWRQESASGSESSERETSEEDEEWPARVAAAMALLDTHQPKPVKVRMAGLRQSAIGDQDTFKRLVAEKFAEAINIDSEEIRVKNIRGGTPRA